MDNKKLMVEACRIANELIKIQKSNKDLDTLFNELLNKKFQTKSLNVMLYLTDILAEKNYYINKVSPFELKK